MIANNESIPGHEMGGTGLKLSENPVKTCKSLENRVWIDFANALGCKVGVPSALFVGSEAPNL